jgi:hypothetical protein
LFYLVHYYILAIRNIHRGYYGHGPPPPFFFFTLLFNDFIGRFLKVKKFWFLHIRGEKKS